MFFAASHERWLTAVVQTYTIRGPTTVADPGGVHGVQTPALLFRCPFLNRTYFENMSLVVTVFS